MTNKIVIIDDDSTTVRLLELILTKSGFTVFSARDGEAGYELVERERPDIVITDFLLPKMDGAEVGRQVKENPALARTKVIIMTAVFKGARGRDVLSGSLADEYLEKPIETSSLMKKVYKLCQELAEAEENAA